MGIVVRPSFRAASRRPWPAITPALVSTRTGLLKPKSLNARGDLCDLRVGVLPRILLVGPQLIERPMLDALGRFVREHTTPPSVRGVALGKFSRQQTTGIDGGATIASWP